ncbi:MAG: PAS domain S-box protein [Bacteroidales bacterium]|nr:PAS domain S-box protein [Bacteroidales bacterium]
METQVRILHIDDNLHDRQLVLDAFGELSEQFHIIEADSREKFENYLKHESFDLVLSDFNILGFDGFKVLEIVKEKNPDIPVIIVTGTGSEEIAVQAMKMGADDYVIKTASHIRNLLPTVRNVLEKRRIQREHKAVIEELRESEERFRLLFENSMDAVLLTCPDGRTLKANPAACRMFGWSEKEMTEKGRNLIMDTSDPRLEPAVKQRNETGWFYGELTGIRKDGTKIPVELSSAIFNDKNGNLNSSVIIRDISERKAAEEAMQKKISQLEHFHQLTVGRELAMIELKKEVNELLRQLGKPEKYT